MNYVMRKVNLIINLQNEQISIRNTGEIHEMGQIVKISISFNRLVFPLNFNLFSQPLTHCHSLNLGQKPIIWQDFCRKLHENEIGTERGARIPSAPWIHQRIRVFNQVAQSPQFQP